MGGRVERVRIRGRYVLKRGARLLKTLMPGPSLNRIVSLCMTVPDFLPFSITPPNGLKWGFHPIACHE
jgi:hypothetical protein